MTKTIKIDPETLLAYNEYDECIGRAVHCYDNCYDIILVQNENSIHCTPHRRGYSRKS